MKNRRLGLSMAVLLLAGSAALLASDSGWMRKVPQADRVRTNPYAGRPQAIAAGKILFAENCAQCHGEDARGLHGRPNLRGPVVVNATDGDLAWILRNGVLWKGMPSWSTLPEPERWQIIAYLRSLPHDPERQVSTKSQ